MNAELYLECSAKYQENVEDVFREATKRALAFNRKQRNNKRKKKCIILWKFFFFFKKDKKPQEPSSSVRQIVLSVLQRLKVGGLHMILQCYKEMSDDTTGKTILQVATWSLKHPLLEGFTFICYVWYFLCIFFFLRNFVLSTFVLLFYQKHIYWRHRVIVCIVM